MDREPPPRQVPKEILTLLEENWDLLCSRWDEAFPNNPVLGEEDDDRDR